MGRAGGEDGRRGSVDIRRDRQSPGRLVPPVWPDRILYPVTQGSQQMTDTTVIPRLCVNRRERARQRIYNIAMVAALTTATCLHLGGVQAEAIQLSVAWDGTEILQYGADGSFSGFVARDGGVRSLDYGADGTLYFTRKSDLPSESGLFSWNGVSETLLNSSTVFGLDLPVQQLAVHSAPSSIPEPSSLVGLFVGAVFVAGYRKRDCK